MKIIFSKIIEIISSIFLEEQKKTSVHYYRDETLHYDGEIENLSLDRIEIVASYKDILPILEAYKYRSEREKGEFLAKLLRESPLFSLLEDRENIVIVPVPMHWSRYLIRSYNHIELLAKMVSQHTGIKTISLLKTSYTTRQSKLAKKERIKNRKGKFYLTSDKNPPEIVILIDDVISTGSTANACAEVLKKAGVKKVYGVFLASNRD